MRSVKNNTQTTGVATGTPSKEVTKRAKSDVRVTGMVKKQQLDLVIVDNELPVAPKATSLEQQRRRRPQPLEALHNPLPGVYAVTLASPRSPPYQLVSLKPLMGTQNFDTLNSLDVTLGGTQSFLGGTSLSHYLV